MKILLLEDDTSFNELVSTILSNKGYEVQAVFTEKEVYELLEDQRFDLFIFDMHLAQGSGLELLKELRSYKITTPAIVMTSNQDLIYLKQCFEYGCDDFLKKPFDIEELYHRIKHVAKIHSLEGDDNILELSKEGRLLKDRNIIQINNQFYEISKKENMLLCYLVTNKTRTISFEELIQNIWEFDNAPTETTIRVYINNIRKILGKESIKTTRGLGYNYQN